MREFLNFIKHFCYLLRISWSLKDNKEFKEFLKYRNVLFTAEKSVFNPKVAMVRHFSLYQKFPTIEDCVDLRNEVLNDLEKEKKIFDIKWEHEKLTSNDLVVVGLDPINSDIFVRGLFCDFLIKDSKEK